MSFIGLKIQHYRVFKYLGNGGMGEVFAAYDERLDRKVALKRIRREHRLKPQVKARLLREARMLSALEHPHICRIYDVLDHQDSDILVLELIEGESLRKIVGPEASGEGPDADPLQIAEQVASALAAAHERGVIHRDLKPDNVMLTPAGDVKVRDFGLARRVVDEDEDEDEDETLQSSSACPQDELETPIMSVAGRFAGTPAYMSPEQVLGEPVSPASDMYALGVLLQEMFTGKPAYETRSMPATLVKVARAQTAPLAGVDPDVAALIERLESKAPARRPSAVDVGERLSWIRDRPRRRRRRMLRLAAMTFLCLSSVALALQTHRISIAAERANREAQRANVEMRRANREAAVSQQVSEFMADLFALADPDRVRPATAEARPVGSITAREILAGGARKISGDLADQPLIRARLMGTIGEIQRKLGLFDDALPLALEALEIRQRHLGPEHPDVAESQAHLANLYLQLGRFDAAAPLYESSIQVRRKLDEADGLELAKCLNGLGIVRWNRGEYEAAEATYLEALQLREQALGPRHPEVATSLDNLAIVYKDQARFAEAEPLYQRSLEIREEVFGPGHHRVAVSLNNLGVLYSDQRRFSDAEPLHERAIAIWEQAFSTEHHTVGVALVNLANVRDELGQGDRSRPLYDRALAIFEATLGPHHPYVGYALAGRGSNLLDAGRYAEAEAPLARAVTILENSLGPEHVEVGRWLEDLARAVAENGEADRADALLERSRRILTGALGADHPETSLKT